MNANEISCPGHGEYTHGELVRSFGRCGECSGTSTYQPVSVAVERHVAYTSGVAVVVKGRDAEVTGLFEKRTGDRISWCATVRFSDDQTEISVSTLALAVKPFPGGWRAAVKAGKR